MPTIIYTNDTRKPTPISAIAANMTYGTIVYEGDGDKKGKKH